MGFSSSNLPDLQPGILNGFLDDDIDLCRFGPEKRSVISPFDLIKHLSPLDRVTSGDFFYTFRVQNKFRLGNHEEDICGKGENPPRQQRLKCIIQENL